MATPLSSFYPLVQPYAPSAPTLLIQRALLDAAIEFCHESLAYRDISILSVAADTPDYDLDVPVGCRLSRVIDVFYNGVEMGKVSFEQVRSGADLVSATTGDATPTTSTFPRKFFQKDLNSPTITLWPVPSQALAAGLVVKAAYEPLPTLTPNMGLPDLLYEQFAATLAHGALHRILRVKGQTFTDLPESDRCGKLFAAGIRDASIVARTGLLATSSSVRLRRFA